VTFGGRLATIFYAIIGIPMMVSVLNDLGSTLMSLVKSAAFLLNYALFLAGSVCDWP